MYLCDILTGIFQVNAQEQSIFQQSYFKIFEKISCSLNIGQTNLHSYQQFVKVCFLLFRMFPVSEAFSCFYKLKIIYYFIYGNIAYRLIKYNSKILYSFIDKKMKNIQITKLHFFIFKNASTAINWDEIESHCSFYLHLFDVQWKQIFFLCSSNICILSFDKFLFISQHIY